MVYIYTVYGMWSFAAYKTTSSLSFSPSSSSCTEYWRKWCMFNQSSQALKKKKQTANLKLGHDTNQTKTCNLIDQENALPSFRLEG